MKGLSNIFEIIKFAAIQMVRLINDFACGILTYSAPDFFLTNLLILRDLYLKNL